jgi:transcriptional regulator with XRE-family HTH domain
MKLSKQIIRIRKLNNLTQEELANDLNVTRQAVSKWERDISLPDLETIKLISNKYNVSIDTLMNNDVIDEEEPVSIKKYIFYLIIFSIPILGFIYLIIQAYVNDNINIRNLAKAILIIIISIIIIFIVLYFSINIISEIKWAYDQLK